MIGKLVVTVPVINQYGWTSCILHELLVKTANPCKKLIIDNGSTDELTKDMLRSVDGHRDFTVLRNEENMGVARAWNQAVEWAKNEGAKYLAILNNDLILPASWDEIMLEPLQEEDVYVSSIAPDKRNIFCAFCFMVKTELFEKIGTFSEEFGKYECEEQDFIVRMKLAGIKFKNILAKDHPYFFHAGGQSQKELFADSHAVHLHRVEASDKFYAKWGHLMSNFWDFVDDNSYKRSLRQKRILQAT